MRKEMGWKERVRLAETFLKLGQDDQYLDRDARDFPWEYVTEVESGGSHRLDMDTSVWFRAAHPSGLMFRWTFEIERHEANGKGHYMIDVDGCQSALASLNPAARKLFAAYLNDAAKKVRAKAVEWEAVTKTQYETADTLERAAKA